jgi:hypothetical protein
VLSISIIYIQDHTLLDINNSSGRNRQEVLTDKNTACSTLKF